MGGCQQVSYGSWKSRKFKYLNFSLAFSRTEKSLKMVLENPGNLLTQEIKCAWKTEEQPVGKIQQLNVYYAVW